MQCAIIAASDGRWRATSCANSPPRSTACRAAGADPTRPPPWSKLWALGVGDRGACPWVGYGHSLHLSCDTEGRMCRPFKQVAGAGHNQSGAFVWVLAHLLIALRDYVDCSNAVQVLFE